MALVRTRTIPTERPPPVGDCSINWPIFHTTWVSTECINIIWSFVKCSNTSIATSVCGMQFFFFLRFTVRWYFSLYRVCSNDKLCGHIIPFIELAFKLFSTSAYIGEFFFAFELKLHFSLFLKNKLCLTDQLQFTFCLLISVPKQAISPSIQRFRTIYIPNLIPFAIILLDLNLLRPN